MTNPAKVEIHFVTHCSFPQRRQQRCPVQVHQQRRTGRDSQAEFGCAASQIGQVVGEQPFQIGADINPARAHHLHPRPVRVVLTRDDVDERGAATAQHEIADRKPQHLTQPSTRLGQNREQQPIPQIADPVAGGRVGDGASVEDGLDLGRQQDRRPTVMASAADPHQRRRCRG
ncbi:hypothetical protein [Nocardia terpenica]|uniref:hypothetical protein n=1 Tax=Nocardia terpenica TaxID=455432 RepID=UPI0031831725